LTGAAKAPVFKRVLLKLSGEALMGESGYGISPEALSRVATELKEVVATGVQLAIVVGGGNIFRGAASTAANMERTTADYIGMLATVMNAMALQDALAGQDVPTHLQSAIRLDQIAEPYNRQRALYHLDQGHVVLFAAGTGNPFFTTDTAASLRGIEINADIVLKATKVDGVYSKDPVRHADATLYSALSYDQVLEQKLAVMDAIAVALCREQNLPVRVFNINKPGNVLRIVLGENEGTLMQAGDGS